MTAIAVNGAKPPADAVEPLLAVRDLVVDFPGPEGPIRAVDGVSFSLRPCETIGLVGESGSGKSVTALSIMGLLPRGVHPTGSVVFDGQEMLGLSTRALNARRGKELAMVFQEPMTSLNPAFTVGEQIAEGVRVHRGASRRDAWARAIEVLDLVGVPAAASRAKAYPHEFSGGMRQRVMIAVALACEPKLLIADEPTTALDVTMQARVLQLLRDLQRDLDMAIVFVTHDLGVVAELCDRVAVMYAGQLVEQATVVDAFDAPHHPYTDGLLRSMPQRAGIGERLPSIGGVVPAPGSLPEGCRFHPRCAFAEEGRCTTGSPELRPFGTSTTRCVRAAELDLGGPR